VKEICLNFNISWPSLDFMVDLTIPGQGVTAIFGPSGSGKTTLLRCISGLERVKNGHLSFNGEIWQNDKIYLPTHKRQLGYVFQEASLFSHLSVLNNLRYGQKRIDSSQRKVSLDHAIELLGISNLLDRNPSKLSGGERQRVAIARALATSPSLLLMDEPLASLDNKRKQEILPYLQKLHDELEIPIIYVGHSPEEISRLADHLVVMNSGKVEASGALNTMLNRLDINIGLGEERGVVLEGEIGEVDKQWNLARVDFSGGSLWTPNSKMAVGKKVRVRVLARDVSLAKVRPEQSSIQNQLLGQVNTIIDDERAGLALVSLSSGYSSIIARLTKRAINTLPINLGDKVWIQIKSVALIDG